MPSSRVTTRIDSAFLTWRPTSLVLGGAAIAILAAVLIFHPASGRSFAGDTPVELAQDLVVILILACIARLAVLDYRVSGWSAFLWLVLASSFLAILLTDMDWAADRATKVVDVDAYLAAVIWLIAAVAIAPTIVDPEMRGRARLALILGFLFQGLAFLLYLGKDSFGDPPALGSFELETVGETLELGYLSFFLCGLALVAAPTGTREIASGAGPRTSSRTNAGDESRRTAIGRHVGIVANRIAFLLWRRRNRGAPFAQFYVERLTSKLDHGKAHRTVGTRAWKYGLGSSAAQPRRPQFSREGMEIFRDLQVPQLHADSHVVDFGCGSLRIGQHFMRTLKAGHYWGLDITGRFIRDGMELLGDDFLDAHRPNLRIISESSLAEAAARKPSLVFSIAVMKHVPPQELQRYWEDLLGMLSPHGSIVVHFDRGTATMQTADMNWAYEMKHVLDLIWSILPSVTVAFDDLGDPKRFAGGAYCRCRIRVTMAGDAMRG